MGRYYWGDIEGKFWFAVQSSDDISNLVSTSYREPFYWEGCTCQINNEDDIWEYCNDDCEQDCHHIFCHDCFTDKKEHIELINDECGYDSDVDDIDKHMYREGNEIVYEIETNCLGELKDNLKNIEDKLGNEIVEQYKKVENDERIKDLGSGVYDGINDIINKWENDDDKEKLERCKLIARYGLGLQIKYVLEVENMSCGIYCEL